MSETRQEAYDCYPKIGERVSLALMKSITERVAKVTGISADKTLLELTKTTLPTPFKQGEPVWMKYCDAEDIFYWGGLVTNVSGPQNQTVTIFDSGHWVRLERRKYSRLAVDIPISFRAVNASSTLVSTKAVYSNQIKNMSVNGLAFETGVPLEMGDELQVNLDVAWPQELVVSGWVVRTEPIEKSEEGLNLVALEFLGLKTREQNLLLEFLDEAQVRPS